MKRFRARFGTMASIILVGVAGCLSIGTGTPPIRAVYVLTPQAPVAAVATPDQEQLAVGLGPVLLPDYLDRNDIVARVATGEIELYPGLFWGAPLKSETPRTLQENLIRLLGTDQVLLFPFPANVPLTLRVPVRVLQFELVSGTGVVLEARWQVLSPDGKTVLLTRLSRYVEQVASQERAGEVVDAMSRALTKLSEEIAAAVRSTPVPNRTARLRKHKQIT